MYGNIHFQCAELFSFAYADNLDNPDDNKYITSRKQAISALERALCQLTVCFEFQSRSDRRTQKLCPGNGIQKEGKKVTVKV